MKLKKELFSKGLKNCSSKECGEFNPQPIVNFSKCKNYKDGLQSRCKTCVANWGAEYYNKNKTNDREKKELEKQFQEQLFKQGFSNCSNKNCKQENPQPLDNFYKDKSKESGIRKQCVHCDKITREKPEARNVAKKRKQTPEYKAVGKKWRNKPEVKEKTLQRERSPEAVLKRKIKNSLPEVKSARAVYGQRPEVKESRNTRKRTPHYREVENKRLAKDRKLNPAKHNSRAAKRRADRALATPKCITEVQLEDIKYIYELCAELQWLSEDKLHVDHIIPLKNKNVSGLHVAHNLQIIGSKDNLRKLNSFDFTYDNNRWRKKI